MPDRVPGGNASYRSRNIDPAVLGRRIRAARIEAGLTQADLASSGSSSKAYISRIENGERRPSPRVLDQIATRLGVRMEELLFETNDESALELRLNLIRAEWLHTHDQSKNAESLASDLATEAEAVGMTGLADEARVTIAQARLSNGHASEAAALLEEITSRVRSQPSSIRGFVTLCRAYVETGSYERALDVAAQARRVISEYGLHGLPNNTELALAEALAHSALGHNEDALAICEQAVRHASAFDAEFGTEHAYWSASQTEWASGAYELALKHAERAASAHEVRTHGENLRHLRARAADLALRIRKSKSSTPESDPPTQPTPIRPDHHSEY